MSPRRVGRHVGGGSEPDDERVARERRDALREALSQWASGVSLVAVRADGRVHALTVSGFLPVSLDPPLVVVSLGANAAPLPYLETGTQFAISILAAEQRGLASRFADTFPVGPSPFPAEGAPVVTGALAHLVCSIEELLPRGDHHLAVGRVERAEAGEQRPGLVYFRRDYHAVGD